MPASILSFKHFIVILTLSFAYSAQAQFVPLTEFGNNPGELTASYLQPKARTSALVVFLHGCVQNAEQLAEQSDLVALAKHHNFTLLLPQQSKKNNVKLCFNWFSPHDNHKDKGEMQSIKNMILALKKQSKADNVYLGGLSAGGAMASAMLVNYPELFTSAAIIAGIPYPCADDIIKAIACMRNGPSLSAKNLAKKVKTLINTTDKLPTLLVIAGKNDKVVNPKNAFVLAQQWALLKHLTTPTVQHYDDYQVSLWQNTNQTPQVKLMMIDNIGHGMSINTYQAYGGTVAPFLLSAPFSSAIEMITFWNLTKNNKNQSISRMVL